MVSRKNGVFEKFVLFSSNRGILPEVLQTPSSIPCRVPFYHSFSRKKNVKLIFLRQNVFIFVSKRQLTKGRVRNFQVPLSRNLLLNPSKSKSNQKSEKLYTHNQIYFAFLYPKFQNFCHQNSNLTFTHQNCSNQSCTSS